MYILTGWEKTKSSTTSHKAEQRRPETELGSGLGPEPDVAANRRREPEPERSVEEGPQTQEEPKPNDEAGAEDQQDMTGRKSRTDAEMVVSLSPDGDATIQEEELAAGMGKQHSQKKQSKKSSDERASKENAHAANKTHRHQQQDLGQATFDNDQPPAQHKQNQAAKRDEENQGGDDKRGGEENPGS